MADGNLMSFKRPAKKREVEGYIGNLESIVGTSVQMNNDTLQTRLSELQSMKQTAETKEKEAYKKLGVKGLRGLQAKVNQINIHLLTFSNKALSKLPLTKSVEGVDYQTLENELYRQIASGEILKTLGIAENYEDLTKEKYEALLVNTINEKMNELRGTSRSQAGKKVQEGISSTATKKRAKLKGYKKELQILLNMQNKSTYSTQITIDVEVPENEVITNITYYPYAFLTQEQKEGAKAQATKTDKAIWRSFKNQLAQCCGPYAKLVNQLLGDGISSQFKPEDFFVESSAQLKGILGELQTALILTELTGKTATFFGNTEENSKKIGVDVALGEVGFQVKNYNIVSTDTWEGFNLKDTITLELFLSKLEQHGLSNGMVQNLSAFYSIKAYNIQATDDYAETASKINNLHKRINLWLQGYGTAFLPLRAYDVGNNLSISNTFYFVGGQRVVPISAIIECYIKYIKSLLQEGVNKTGQVISYTLNTSNVPQTYVDYHKQVQENKEDKDLFIGYNMVFKSLQMKNTMNITLPSITKMLEKYLNKI